MLEDKIESGIFVMIYDDTDEELLRLIADAAKDRNIEIWHTVTGLGDTRQLRSLSESEMEDIRNIRRLYDFSDRVCYVCRSEQFGSLFNYIDNGLLTKEEMAEAVLYNI